jgi:hypothetical protein
MSYRGRALSRGWICGAALLLGLSCGCSSIKATYKTWVAKETGREGWWKGDVTPASIEAVRNTERIIISSGPRPEAYSIKIDPRSLSFPVPPAVINVIDVQRTGLDGEIRLYTIPDGWTWERVRRWYLDWFDFKPAP